MAFRAGEAASNGFDEVETYLVPRARDASEAVRARSREMLLSLVEELGPVVDFYPSWHPLVAKHDPRNPETYPNKQSGYKGLDHTRHFAHGFITCPYGDGQDVLDSVAALPQYPWATITAERLDVQFYSPQAKPIVVKCEWAHSLNDDHTIPLSLAIPLILEMEVPGWRWSQRAENWETMRPYLLGRPHGARSSLFVNQEAGQSIKTIWNALIETGMFGPVKG